VIAVAPDRVVAALEGMEIELGGIEGARIGMRLTLDVNLGDRLSAGASLRARLESGPVQTGRVLAVRTTAAAVLPAALGDLLPARLRVDGQPTTYAAIVRVRPPAEQPVTGARPGSGTPGHAPTLGPGSTGTATVGATNAGMACLHLTGASLDLSASALRLPPGTSVTVEFVQLMPDDPLEDRVVERQRRWHADRRLGVELF
jgi:hypothetical protein